MVKDPASFPVFAQRRSRIRLASRAVILFILVRRIDCELAAYGVSKQ